jgi:hypothetical protein
LSFSSHSLSLSLSFSLTKQNQSEKVKTEKNIMAGWAIAVHGGAGVDPNLPPQRQEEAKQLLTHCLNLGISALRSNASAVDVVELVVCLAIPSIFRTFKSSPRLIINLIILHAWHV